MYIIYLVCGQLYVYNIQLYVISFAGYHLRADLVKFSQMLTSLQNQPVFQLQDFENKIEYIRNVVAQVFSLHIIYICVVFMHVSIMRDI